MHGDVPFQFPVTICVVCYGEHSSLAERFFSSLYRHSDPRLFELRVGLNEVEPATSQLVSEYAVRFGNVDVFNEPRNIFKAPLMRRMFTEKPLTHEWVIWFDDDSSITRGDWLARLALAVEREPEIDQWGESYALWRRDPEIEAFIKKAPWYRSLPLMRGKDMDGNEAAEFHFVTGGFWAMKSSVIRALDWPDPRLLHACEDFLLGEALRQNGCRFGGFHHGIKINGSPRRNPTASEVEQLPSP